MKTNIEVANLFIKYLENIRSKEKNDSLTIILINDIKEKLLSFASSEKITFQHEKNENVLFLNVLNDKKSIASYMASMNNKSLLVKTDGELKEYEIV